MGDIRALKQALLNEYGHFADKRIKDIDRGSRFIADDRINGGIASDGGLYGWFCSVIVDVTEADKVHVTLQGQIPDGTAVRLWMQRYDLGITKHFGRNTLTFDVGEGDASKLSELAQAFRSIVAKGNSYDVPAYKYSCPRTADALDRLHRALESHFKP